MFGRKTAASAMGRPCLGCPKRRRRRMVGKCWAACAGLQKLLAIAVTLSLCVHQGWHHKPAASIWLRHV